MRHSDSLASLGAALAKAHAELDNVTKDASNPHFKSKYATLAAITDTTRPVLAKHGLSLIQMPSYADGVVQVETMLLHSSGEWISETAGAPAPKLDPQGVGSAITYLRRYAQSAFCNIAQEDDDGNAASRPAPARSNGAPQTNGSGLPWDRALPIGKNKGTKLRDLSREELNSALGWCIADETRADKFRDLIAAIEATIENFYPDAAAFPL